jgi:hypothetical protein
LNEGGRVPPSTAASGSSPTGLAADAREYRRRLDRQSDDQIDAWAKELMRDLSIRRGVGEVMSRFMRAARLDQAGLERVFSAGGGPIATLGRTAQGDPMVPAIQLFFLVDGLHRTTADTRERLIDFLVAGFHELAFI